jgi:hypothetical protein
MAVLPPPRPLIRDAFIPVGTLEPTKLATIYGQGLFVSSEGVITADKALSPRVRNALQKYGFENVAHEPEVPQEERIIKALHEMLENGEKLKVMENTPACVSCIHFNSPPPNPYTSSVSRCAHPIHAKYTHDRVRRRPLCLNHIVKLKDRKAYVAKMVSYSKSPSLP